MLRIGSWPNGVPLLLLNSLLMSLGFYALIPYLSYYTTHTLAWSPLLAGALLMVRQMSQQGLTLITGICADRIGYKVAITTGFVLRGAGFAMFAGSNTPLNYFAAAIVAGLGGSLFEPVSDAALTALTPEQERRRIYAVKKVVGNVGMVLSALLGAALMSLDFRWLSLVSGAIFVVMGLLTGLFLPDIHVQVSKIPIRTMGRTVLRDVPFLFVVLANVCYFFLYMQLYLTVPIRVVALTGRTESVSATFFALALLVIIGQVPINEWVSRIPSTRAYMGGLLVMGCGLWLAGSAGGLVGFAAGFLGFALGVMVCEPASYDLTARYAKSELTATYFGLSYMALAVGGGLGQGLGGWLLGWGSSVGMPTVVWWVCFIVSLVGCMILLKLNHHQKRRESMHTPG